MTESRTHRLEGLEPDNLLAFLALLGLLRALEAFDSQGEVGSRLTPRAGWTTDEPPLRAVLCLARAVSKEFVTEASCNGIDLLLGSVDFDGRRDLNHSREECRHLLMEASHAAASGKIGRVDMLAALMSDGAVKDDKSDVIIPTPLCLLFGQGHQHFLERLARVPAEPAPPPRGRGKTTVRISAPDCLGEALFHPWHRSDPTSAFRWDPEESVRYALMAGDPTDSAYKPGTQHGANRLAAIGLAALTIAPMTRAGAVRPSVLGGRSTANGFSFAWPIWRDPASLASIRALLSHPDLREPERLAHLGVKSTMEARRISVGKFMNFSRALSIA